MLVHLGLHHYWTRIAIAHPTDATALPLPQLLRMNAVLPERVDLKTDAVMYVLVVIHDPHIWIKVQERRWSSEVGVPFEQVPWLHDTLTLHLALHDLAP